MNSMDGGDEFESYDILLFKFALTHDSSHSFSLCVSHLDKDIFHFYTYRDCRKS